jgi:serine/threonine protein phosphatase PrpC
MGKAVNILNDFSMDEAPAKLIELANSSGGRDNISVAVLQV